MGSRIDPGAGRQDEGRCGSQAEEWSFAGGRPIQRVLSATDAGFAPAKINLFLHVGRVGDDGYHPTYSLVTFADFGDWLRLIDEPDLVIDGPFAEGLDAGADNLVIRARDLLLKVAGGAPFGFHLTKNLPLASGIGGGSADAAAALRLAAGRMGLDDPALLKTATSLGADVPVCLDSIPALCGGRGDQLEQPPRFPPLPAVLVNPGAPSPTAAAYRAYDTSPSTGGADRAPPPGIMPSPREVARFLADCRNDLEVAVSSRIQVVADVLDVLRRQPETLLARMSGSGATCFALAADADAAARLADRIAGLAPTWWVRATLLRGSP